MNTMQEDTIDLIELAKHLWKNILAIMLAAVLVGSAAFVYTANQPAQYQAKTSLFVNSNAVSIGSISAAISASDLQSSNSLVSVYIYILKSRTTLEEVIQEAGLTYSPERLAGMISTKTVSNTSAFEVTVTTSKPAEAELIANTIAKVLPTRIADIVNGTSVRVVDYAVIPAHRSGPNLMKNTAIGILAGAVLAAGVLVVLFLMDDRSKVMIHTADELHEMYPDLMVLALIPNMQVSEKKSGYYSSYYGEPKANRKGGKYDGRKQGA